MRIFKSKWFAKFAAKNGIGDGALRMAVAEIEAGNFSADLGGNVYKQRVARQGQGKRGGYRTIVLFKQGEKAFFVSGYAKSKLDTIEDDDLGLFRMLARKYLCETEDQINGQIEDGSLVEIIQEV
jgi:hypothetical protein